MNRREFNQNKANLTGGRGEDDLGLEFWGFALMSYERADVVKIMKRAAKEALAEYLKWQGVKDTHWHQHRFMGLLGKKARTALLERENSAFRRGLKSRRKKRH
jgi:hypothetical protein